MKKWFWRFKTTEEERNRLILLGDQCLKEKKVDEAARYYEKAGAKENRRKNFKKFLASSFGFWSFVIFQGIIVGIAMGLIAFLIFTLLKL